MFKVEIHCYYYSLSLSFILPLSPSLSLTDSLSPSLSLTLSHSLICSPSPSLFKVNKEPFSEMKEHKKLIEKGKPDDVPPGYRYRTVSGRNRV